MLNRASITMPIQQIMFIPTEMESWMGPIICYLESGDLLLDKVESAKYIKLVAWYVIIGNKLYKRGFNTPLLRCLTP